MSFKLFYAFILAAVLAGCSRDQSQLAAKTANTEAARTTELMRAVFADRYNAKQNTAVAMIQVDGAEAYHRMSPVAMTDLPGGRTVLIVNGAPSDENGVDMSAHASSGMLNVYILRRDGAQWKVLERRENVDLLGSSGNIGVVEWITLGPGKHGFIVSNGGVWQGYWINNAAIYALDGGLHRVGSFAEGSGNDGACVPEVAECWNVNGDIHFAAEPQPSGYQDIVVDFIDKRYTVTDSGRGDTVEHIKSQTKQTARYHFNGKEYVLASGTNPVPGI